MSDMYSVLIVGVGALGRRHLEACLALPDKHYVLTAVEPSDGNWAVAEAAVNAIGKKVERVTSIAELPKTHFDVAVIATRSDIRATVLQELLSQVTLGALILEKVLFQKLDEYGSAADLIAAKGVPTWVNCPRRMWPGYIALKERYGAEIVECIQLGHGWDIGCNGIHYLDIFDFLCGADGVRIGSFTLPVVPEPAKRPGMQHIFGRCAGTLAANGREVPFVIEARKDECPNFISLRLRDGTKIEIFEKEPLMEVVLTDALGTAITEVFPTLYQSRLTNLAVENALESGDPGLTDYVKSRMLHEAFLSSLHQSLLKYIPDIAPGYCPVT